MYPFNIHTLEEIKELMDHYTISEVNYMKEGDISFYASREDCAFNYTLEGSRFLLIGSEDIFALFVYERDELPIEDEDRYTLVRYLEGVHPLDYHITSDYNLIEEFSSDYETEMREGFKIKVSVEFAEQPSPNKVSIVRVVEIKEYFYGDVEEGPVSVILYLP